MAYATYDHFVKPRRSISKVYVHCSASDHAHHAKPEVIKAWHTDKKPKGNGWSDIGYHYLIDFEGVIWECRPLRRTPAAQYPYNRGTIAICVAGGQYGKPDAFTDKQMEALRGICADIDFAYKGTVSFHGHSEVANKACPVFDYAEVLNLGPKGFMKDGTISFRKLEAAGSTTVKAAKANQDAGAAAVGLGGAATAAQVIAKSTQDLSTAKEVVTQAQGWRGVMNTGADLVGWCANHIGIILLFVGVYIIWRNRQIIVARIKDEVNIGRIKNARWST